MLSLPIDGSAPEDRMCLVNREILRVQRLNRMLLSCADHGDLYRNDDSCGVLFGIVRDCAYRMLDLAEAEKRKHMERGGWADPEKAGTDGS
ncbi:MAG: hypothetical protein GX089_04825 [Fibrobacter sp.]|nr:hypothetical protein [Fibrobacter sp.]